jgi:hypothetical protein
MDGISNYYSRDFVERWRYFVADSPLTCTARYAGWSTRAEISLPDIRYNTDRIVNWLWLNNVGVLRSPAPLDHPRLTPVSQQVLTVDRTHRVTSHIYRMTAPVARVFTIPNSMAPQSEGGLPDEERALQRLAAEEDAVHNVAATVLSGSHVRFEGDFAGDRLVLASMNYHAGWHVSVDGGSEIRVRRGPFGMIAIPPQPGTHRYDLRFRSPTTPLVPMFMALAIAALWIGAAVHNRIRIPALPALAQLSPARMTVAAVIVGAVLVATPFIRSKGATNVQAAWLDGSWPGRLELKTQGVALTATVKDFPVRVEVPSANEPFWQAAGDPSNLRFTAADGMTALPYEIELLDPDKRRLVAWVGLKELAPGPQIVGYLYFGRAADDASGSAAAEIPALSGLRVWHLVPDEIDIGDDSAAVDWTLEFDLNAHPARGRSFGLFDDGAAGRFHLYLHSGGYLVLEASDGARVVETALTEIPIERTTWTHLSLSRTANYLRLAVGGQPYPARRIPASLVNPTGRLRTGVGRYGPLDGLMTEVRFSRGIARPPDWTLAAAVSQQSGFVAISGVQTAAAGRR